MKKVTRFVCDHCKYTRARKKTVEKHEAICFNNPASKSCATCANYEHPVIVRENETLIIPAKHYEEMILSEKLQVNEFEDGNINEQYNTHYCHAKGCIDKLTTKCPLWKGKEK